MKPKTTTNRYETSESISMSNSAAVYQAIKKQNGEAFAKTLHNHHSGLLEIPDIANIVKYAGRKADPLLPYLINLLGCGEDTATYEPQDPFDLFEKAGCEVIAVDTWKKRKSVKKLLRTFNDRVRHREYHITAIHSVDKSAPIISIRMIKPDVSITIKNRNNSATVPGYDSSPFHNDPDNIIKGLSSALRARFKYLLLPDGFQVLTGNQVLKYHTELGWSDYIYYGDQAWIQKGQAHIVDRSAGDALFDRFLFDNKKKMLTHLHPGIEDSFADDFNKYYGGNSDLYVDKDGNLCLNNDILIGTDQSRIKTLYLPGFEEMSDHCLCRTPYLTQIVAPALRTTGNDCLGYTRDLIKATLPVLETTGNNFLQEAHSLTQANFPKLKTFGDYCLQQAGSLAQANFPKLETTGNNFLQEAHSLTQAIFPKLKTTGHSFLYAAFVLEHFESNTLETMGVGCLTRVPVLRRFIAPTLKEVGFNCLTKTPNLEYIEAQSIQNIGDHSFEELISKTKSIPTELRNIPPLTKRAGVERACRSLKKRLAIG